MDGRGGSRNEVVNPLAAAGLSSRTYATILWQYGTYNSAASHVHYELLSPWSKQAIT